MDALETLLRRDGAALLTMARCWLGSAPAAMDAIAEGVAVVANRRTSVPDREVLRRAILEAAIERLAGQKDAGEEMLAGLLPTFDDDGARVGPAGETVTLEAPAGAALFRASVQDVPVPFRQVLLLVDMEGWPMSDAAARLGLTLPLLKRRLHLARMAMTTLVQRRGQMAMAAA